MTRFMRQLLARAFAPVIDSDQALRRHILWIILIRVLLFTLLLGITFFFQGKGQPVILPPRSATLVFLSALYLFSIGSALILQKTTAALRRFGLIQLLADALFTACLVYGTGGSQSVFTPLFVVPVIAGGLIFYRIGGLIPASAATLLYGAILGCEFFRLIPGYLLAASIYKPLTNPFTASNLFAIYGITFFLAALLSGQIAGRLRIAEDELSKTVLVFDRLSLLYKQIFDDIATGIITIDGHDIITSFNRAAEHITGYPTEEILGRFFAACFPQILLEEHQGRNVCDLVKKNGTLIRAGYSYAYLNMPTEKGRETMQGKWKVITLQDISQIERMERQVREAEKMAAIGELSASIAHDFRNPLAAISGSAQLLAMEQAEAGIHQAGSSRALLEIIVRESNRMAKTIADFLQFARPAQVQPEWFDLSRLIDEVVSRIFQGQGPPPLVTISKALPANLSCWGDRQQIQTILSHLLENACLAGGGQRTAIVVAGREEGSGDLGELQLEVRDSGPGIPVEIRDRVFAPFFSTRADGTGLGLAIVRQIMENHRGRIEIADSADYPCIMRLSLPLGPAPTL